MFYVRQHNIPLNEVPVIIPELLRSYVIPSSVSQSWPILCDAINCSPLDSSVLGIFQARILEWVAIPSPGDLPNPGIKPMSPTLAFFTTEPTGKPLLFP